MLLTDFTNAVKETLGFHVDVVEIVKRDELHKFVVLPKRWVTERTFGWLDKVRPAFGKITNALFTTPCK